jgi:hypothetical protein
MTRRIADTLKTVRSELAGLSNGSGRFQPWQGNGMVFDCPRGCVLLGAPIRREVSDAS